jgi:hypothetical protein
MKTTSDSSRTAHEPWNKGKLIGQKPPLKLHEIWTVRAQLRMTGMRFPNQKSSRFLEWLPALTAANYSRRQRCRLRCSR